MKLSTKIKKEIEWFCPTDTGNYWQSVKETAFHFYKLALQSVRVEAEKGLNQSTSGYDKDSAEAEYRDGQSVAYRDIMLYIDELNSEL